MSADRDPRRWAEGDPEVPEALTEAIRESRGAYDDVPTEAQLAAVAARLGPLLGGGGPGSGGAGKIGGGSGSGSGGGSGSGPAGGSGAGASSSATSASVAASAGIASGTKLVIGFLIGAIAVGLVGALVVVPDLRERTRRSAEAAETAQEIAGDGGPTGVDTGTVVGSTPQETARTEGDLEGDLEGNLEEDLGDPATSPAPERRAPEGANEVPSEEPRAPRAELEILEEAQDALSSDPARALALADEHRLGHAAGALAQEREVLAIDALLRLGRRSEAENRADRLRAAHPNSGQLRRVDQLLSAD